MSFAFYFPTKASSIVQWVPETVPDYPALEPVDFPEQVTSITSGGTLYVQDKGQFQELFSLSFSRVSQVDRDAALVFFKTVKKSFESFEYEDLMGTLHTVRWMNSFNFQLVIFGKYSGLIELRKQ
ncbi:MAG: hypothetical protein HOK41_17705 [Nitrospina sp.]|jgi:hypothetical protein|nr:hypothetical protein [Nitrospina sp.]MBT6716636.1 hypothetical protein [Nitrospina sp.]